jgi:hypothetical protein
MVALENLKVYDKALTSAASLGQCSGLVGQTPLRDGPFGADRVDAARIGLEADRGNHWPIDEVCEKVCD